jgi:twitching motility two-component system response regulator PilH
LVVEQEPGLAQAIALYLSAAGVRARVATDGLAGLHELQREAPDLVVLDLAAPVVSGFRLLHLLKRDAATRHVPVLVLSGVTFQEAREAAVGADDFLEKPVGPREVVARARRLLDLAARTRAARPDRRARTG